MIYLVIISVNPGDFGDVPQDHSGYLKSYGIRLL